MSEPARPESDAYDSASITVLRGLEADEAREGVLRAPLHGELLPGVVQVALQARGHGFDNREQAGGHTWHYWSRVLSESLLKAGSSMAR